MHKEENRRRYDRNKRRKVTKEQRVEGNLVLQMTYKKHEAGFEQAEDKR